MPRTARDSENAHKPSAPLDSDPAHSLLWTHQSAPAAYGLDATGLPLLCAFHRATVADETDALAEATTRFTACAHLLPRLPHARTWHWLSAKNLSWASRARANQRIWHAGQPHTLRQCHAMAGDAGSVSVHWRGRIVQALLRHLRVAVPIPGGRVCGLLDAWFADLRCARTGASVAVRNFLLPAGLDHERAQALIAGHLRAHALAELAGRAAMHLARPSTLAANAVDGNLAAALATLACRVDAEDSPWAMELRVTLRNLVDRRRRHSAVVMLDALLTLLATRDALRELGVPEGASLARYDDVPGA
jgi:flagellar biosynthesis protein FlhF